MDRRGFGDYLVAQIDAGADAIQIFDSWAGVLGDQAFEEYAVKPVRRIVDAVRALRPAARIIAFAKEPAIISRPIVRERPPIASGSTGPCRSLCR